MSGDIGVIGAGVVGLSTAYYLARHGIKTVVYDSCVTDDRNASWGNAGHVLPVMSTPITSAKNIKDTVSGLLRRNSFMSVPKNVSLPLVAFLGSFAGNSTTARWSRSLSLLAPLNNQALTEYEWLESEGIHAGFSRAPFVSAFQAREHTIALLAELSMVAAAGVPVEVELLDKHELVTRVPLAKETGNFGVVVKNQGLLNPPLLLSSLRGALADWGVKIEKETAVRSVEGLGSRGVRLIFANGTSTIHRRVVIATGARLGELAVAHGVRTRVLAGFGYSVSVEVDEMPKGMLYFPEAKIATTPLGDRLRVSSLLEIDYPSREYRVESGQRLLSMARRAIPNAHWDKVSDPWHGARPISATGRPVIGETSTKNVYVNGGHGMWGVALGPISGRLLAEAIVSERSRITYPGFAAQ